MKPEGEIKVWDIFVRSFHWILVAAFLTCFITEGKPRWIHVNAGYLIAILVALRVLWGFVGTPHARFGNFVKGPKEVFLNLRDVALFQAKRHTGHDAAGGAMIVALLVFVFLTAVSGMAFYGAKDKAGPFAAFEQTRIVSALPSLVGAASADSGRHERNREEEGGWLKDLHEFFANLTFTLAAVHVGAVLLVSFETRENLVRSMITGRKRP